MYALQLEERWEEGHNEAEGQYCSIYPKGDWNYGLLDGLARQPVTNSNGLYKGKVSDTTETITLILYGCTKVRIVAFPVVR